MFLNALSVCTHKGHVYWESGWCSEQPHQPEAVDGLEPASEAALCSLYGLLKHLEDILRDGGGLSDVSLQLALQTVGVIIVTLGHGQRTQTRPLLLNLVCGVHCQAPGAGDQVAPLEEAETVLKALFAVSGEHLRVGGQEDPAQPDEVVLAHLDAGARYLDLEHREDVVILGADVRVAAEGGHGHCLHIE